MLLTVDIVVKLISEPIWRFYLVQVIVYGGDIETSKGRHVARAQTSATHESIWYLYTISVPLHEFLEHLLLWLSINSLDVWQL